MRLRRWLSQGKASRAELSRAFGDEERMHDEVATALEGARLELDQAAIVQLL